MAKKKGLTSTIALLILIIVLLVVIVPFLMYLQYLQQSSQVSSAVVNNYAVLKQLQQSAVVSGHPAIYFEGGTVKGSIFFEYTNGTFVPPVNLTVISILYLNNGVWTNITSFKYPIVINQTAALSLPPYASNVPIVIVTSLGNIFYLTPNSSLGPYSPASKGGVEIAAQIYMKNNIYSPIANISTNITGQFKNYSLPIMFPNQTGTFAAKVPQYVYYELPNGTVITGIFHNWYVIGKAILNSSSSEGIKVTLEGSSVVLIANYTELIVPITLNVQVIEPNAPSIAPITIEINGQSYQVPANIRVDAGYISVYIPQNYELFNNTLSESNGYIYEYKYQYSEYQNKIYNIPSYILFISPTASNPTLYIYYTEYAYYVYITINCVNGPGGMVLHLNGTQYNYGKSYWIMAGYYEANPTGSFNSYSGLAYNPSYITYLNEKISLEPPLLVFPIDITEPGTITVYYTEVQYQPL
ncbi:hypothetical protein [Sulfurisphaera ohwakuensis]|uniref:Uncharacterized protein n=1 Tax=Sulfurisphaera ohwakuensis TaxID=69656 RepID=A0A650CFW6_SULOH|nr:hypothetical protein [Sulfurisphaera ohwakuensis]MBB5254091.1 hypothetical protein [Sulfurisphaera ohwakuensis]QGR16683.1 hypothetical protein D1869_05405 [Sulfurisphaera ohwakuensis]